MTSTVNRLACNPVEFCRFWNRESNEHRVVFWQWPCDLKREILLPPKHFLLVKADHPFRASIIEARKENEQVISCEESLPASDGTHFVLFIPCGHATTATRRALKITLFEKNGIRHEIAPLLFLSEGKLLSAPTQLDRKLLNDEHVLSATGRQLRNPIRWGKLTSKYDALLAANLQLSGRPLDHTPVKDGCLSGLLEISTDG